ncbi:MAG: cache domain-containing protein [Candidatus Anammoxibacter sp.]
MVRPIKGKLGIIFLILALLPLFVMRLIVYPITQKTLRNEIVNDLARVGDRQIALLKGWLKEREKDAIVIASDPGVIRSMELMQDVDEEFGETVEHLQFIKEQYGYKGISVIDRNGRVRITTELNLTGKDVSKFDYFKDALSGETFVTKIRPSEVEVENELGQMELGLPTMFVFTPINKGTANSNIGVVILRLDVVEISKMMQGIKLGESGETYLINKEGFMVTESKFAKQLRNDRLINKRTSLELKVVDQSTGEFTLAAKRCLDGGSGYNGFGYKDYRDINVIGYWRWIPEYDMGLIAEIDVEEGFGVLYKLRNSTLIVFAFMALGMVIIAFAVGKRISVPITALSEAADRIANGDFSQTVEVKTDDELNELANSLNKISGMLKSASKETNDVKNHEADDRS